MQFTLPISGFVDTMALEAANGWTTRWHVHIRKFVNSDGLLCILHYTGVAVWPVHWNDSEETKTTHRTRARSQHPDLDRNCVHACDEVQGQGRMRA